MNPTISIIIATYNAGATLQQCLNTIIPQLNQNVELIIIDGFSSDDTKDIINRYRREISYFISEPDKGIYDAWNKGVKVAKGEWIMFIGADDILLENAIETYLGVINNTNDIKTYDYISAQNEYADINGNVINIIGKPAIWGKMRKGMSAAHVGSLHNKHNLFETIGGYDLQFKICADYDLLLRKRNRLKSLFIEHRFARMRTGGMSFSFKAINEAFKIRAKNHSVNIIINIFMYLKSWIALKTYSIRHQLKKDLL